MPNISSDVVVFRVIGELRDDPGHLLLASPDGRWYDYDIARGTVAPVERDESWRTDVQDGPDVRIWTMAPRVVA